MISEDSSIAHTSTKHRSTVVIVVQKSPTPQRFRAFLLSISSNVAIESHGVTAYNRTKFLDDRRVMLQEWADYLDKLKNDPP